MSSKKIDLVRSSRTSEQCCSCSDPVGDGPKRFPVRVAAADGSEPETWCPRCFAYKRAPMEPERWPGVAAVVCATCEHETLDHRGGVACVACGSRAVFVMPPANMKA